MFRELKVLVWFAIMPAYIMCGNEPTVNTNVDQLREQQLLLACTFYGAEKNKGLIASILEQDCQVDPDIKLLDLDTEFRMIRGGSPLHNAVKQGSVEVVRLLLEKGATPDRQVDLQDEGYKSAFDLAMSLATKGNEQ